MIETAFVFDKDGSIIHWHLPPGRTGGSLPDSRGLWDIMWENREILGGVAHTHPWSGQPWPSMTDVTTFSACERALGRRLIWPIITFDRIECFRWRKSVRGMDGAYDLMEPESENYPRLSQEDIEQLRVLSGKEAHKADDKPLDAPFEPDWTSSPGETIQELLDENAWSHLDLAMALELDPSKIGPLLSGMLPINEALAQALADSVGGSRQFWLNREKQYRCDLARLARKAEIDASQD
jgi:plasmid maintenance system antidote protein VapI